ncbi:MAG: hypothetical protein WAZ19_04850 [Anaerolineae bacterium]
MFVFTGRHCADLAEKLAAYAPDYIDDLPARVHVTEHRLLVQALSEVIAYDFSL